MPALLVATGVVVVAVTVVLECACVLVASALFAVAEVFFAPAAGEAAAAARGGGGVADAAEADAADEDVVEEVVVVAAAAGGALFGLFGFEEVDLFCADADVAEVASALLEAAVLFSRCGGALVGRGGAPVGGLDHWLIEGTLAMAAGDLGQRPPPPV